jgi:hypothetical protein
MCWPERSREAIGNLVTGAGMAIYLARIVGKTKFQARENNPVGMSPCRLLAGDDFPNMPPATGLAGFGLRGLQICRAGRRWDQGGISRGSRGSWLNSAPGFWRQGKTAALCRDAATEFWRHGVWVAGGYKYGVPTALGERQCLGVGRGNFSPAGVASFAAGGGVGFCKPLQVNGFSTVARSLLHSGS